MSFLISMLLLSSSIISNFSYTKNNSFNDVYHSQHMAESSKTKNVLNKTSTISYYTPEPKNEKVGGDAYEWNNNPDTAVNLNPDNYYTGSYNGTFHTKINNLTLDTYANLYDYDYFYFKLLYESNVSLLLTGYNSNYCSFDFFLMKLDYPRVDFDYTGNSKATHELVNLVEDDSNDITKSYNGVLKPGTYYILLHCKSTQPFGVDIKYDLTLDVIKKIKNRVDISITDLKFNKDLGGAVWLADYLPLGFKNIFIPYITADFYNSQTTGINVEDYALNDLMNLFLNNEFRVAEFYIWDPHIKIALSEILLKTIDIIDDQISLNSKITNNVNTVVNLIDKTITVTCTLISAGGKLTPYSTIISVGTTIINKSFQFLLKFLLNTYVYTNIQVAKEYRDYLEKINTALGIIYTDDTHQMISDDYFSSFVPIALPCFCTFTSSGSSLIPSSFIRSVSFNNNQNNKTDDNFIASGDVIPHSQSGNNFIDGDIYAITSETNLLNPIDSLQKVTSYPYLEPYIEEITLEEPGAIGNIYKNEFHWYKFEATKSSDYSFYTVEHSSTSSTDGFKYGSIIEVFTSVVAGHSNLGRIKKIDGGYFSTDGVQKGSYYQKHLTAGEVLYFRVSCGDIYYLNHSISFVAQDYFITRLPHTHDYTDNYVRESMTKHRSYCSCSLYILEGHIVPSGGTGLRKYCLLCGGEATGIVGQLSLTSIVDDIDCYFFSNNSYIYNGVAYLSNEDITLFEMGILDIPWH